MPLTLCLAGVLMVCLTLYALGAGADFGGGVWDMLATGPRSRAQRDTIAHAIGPIWEANHIWLILVVVVLFVAFPVAFAALATALHIPLTLMLVGVVLRGSAFVFRGYGGGDDAVQLRWGRIFAMASIVTPVLLGVCAGAVASGNIRMREGRVVTDFVSAWLAPFPMAIGLFTLTLFAFLAAVYLTVEAREPALREDFRRRALGAAAAVFVAAFGTLGLALLGAPMMGRGLTTEPWAPALHLSTGVAAVAAIWALWSRRFRLARVAAAAQVSLILWGWALAQYPYLIPPDLTIRAAAAPRITLVLSLWVLGTGALVLFPSLIYLFRVFKRAPVGA